jgi:hypothetical protein
MQASSYVRPTRHQTSGWSTHRAWDGWGMWHAWGRWKVHTGAWWGDLWERDHLEDFGVDGTIILKLILKKQYGRQLHPLTLYPCIHWTGGPQSWYGCSAEYINILPTSGNKLRFLRRPAHRLAANPNEIFWPSAPAVFIVLFCELHSFWKNVFNVQHLLCGALQFLWSFSYVMKKFNKDLSYIYTGLHVKCLLFLPYFYHNLTL